MYKTFRYKVKIKDVADYSISTSSSKTFCDIVNNIPTSPVSIMYNYKHYSIKEWIVSAECVIVYLEDKIQNTNIKEGDVCELHATFNEGVGMTANGKIYVKGIFAMKLNTNIN